MMKTMLFQRPSTHRLKRINQFLLVTALGFFSLLLTSCDPRSPGINPTEPVPLNLKVSPQPDSLLTLPTGLDFAVISKVGQGPTGSLIRWSSLGSPSNNFTAYTYDQQGRLVGSCEQTSFGYDLLQLAHYQGSYRTYVYTGFDYSRGTVSPRRVDGIGWVSKYEYDDQNRLGQVLIYEHVGDRFKLNHIIQYEYTAAGHLQLTRDATGLAFKSIGLFPVVVSYWQDGDIIQTEQYLPNQTPVKSTQQTFYNQVSNPRARLQLWPQPILTAHYPIGWGVSSPDYESFQYRYGYDAQGRLSSVQQRSLNGYAGDTTRWTEWTYQEEFTYAP
ncbi:hypothetical protein [Spirosoma endbachense]|uniref:RHS repeat protein n=1 Tax=Spirosoma endbachense TaxID=2666025 RepID=A0A6P1WB92_9BACT|nr:hypothetical protein [Spirosoma endbachense]QHW01037.1 hypothetical protein GJR95_41070 [Spirosoma endbachense]